MLAFMSLCCILLCSGASVGIAMAAIRALGGRGTGPTALHCALQRRAEPQRELQPRTGGRVVHRVHDHVAGIGE